MIESISVKNVATYGDSPQEINGLKKINFIYGSNGSGKTTISRIIKNPNADNFKSCKINWKNGAELEALVYNRDFVETNFKEDMKGIFTLGDQDISVSNEIANVRNNINNIEDEIQASNKKLNGENGTDGKKANLAQLEDIFKEKCWRQKIKFNNKKISKALNGFKDSKEAFKKQVIVESDSNKSELKLLEELERKAEVVFGDMPVVEPTIQKIAAEALINLESSCLLKKIIIGKNDVDIADMIKQLDCSDWVKTGKSHYFNNNGVCPFCQQATPTSFAESLNKYFDEAFTEDIKNIESLCVSYKTGRDALLQNVEELISRPSKFLDLERIKAKKENLDSKMTFNCQQLELKKREPSRVVELSSIEADILELAELINSANNSIANHNTTVNNFEKEKKTEITQVWRYILEELNADLMDYKTKKVALENGIRKTEEDINQLNNKKLEMEAELKRLIKQTSTTQASIDDINKILTDFGFSGFTLAKADKSTHNYKLIRADGKDARETLSEGEKTFLTFLYFYHLLKGSHSESHTAVSRVVVFDDPISSLDSDILFLVSSLIKRLVKEVRKNIGEIKQIFILTHNTYFHKEVTYDYEKNKNKETNSFFTIQKYKTKSIIKYHESNPIKNSYDLLWAEVRRPDRSNTTIQNTLRRILENYFKMMGGIDINKLCEKFDYKEMAICNCLISWLHDGSHNAGDDICMSIDEAMFDTYLDVFRKIFEKHGHIAHYKMMMGDSYVESSAEASSV
jgi:wobble nucleotide-excising tRNase